VFLLHFAIQFVTKMAMSKGPKNFVEKFVPKSFIDKVSRQDDGLVP
jgi:hypothetical protein